MRRTLLLYRLDTTTQLPLLFADQGIRAGFPSPAQDYLEEAIDLNKELIRHPSSTFLGRVAGDSMKDDNILEGDLIVIDKVEKLRHNDLAVCCIDGDFTLKRVHIEENGKVIWLRASNPAYQPIKVTEDNEFIIWGIVTRVLIDPRHPERIK